MGRLLNWVEKQEKKNRRSQVRNFVLNYCQRNVRTNSPGLRTVENLDAHWESGALSQLEIDGVMSKISAAWRTKVWSERKSAETVKRVARLTPDVNAIFSKLLKDWGLEVSDGMNECILRAKEDVDREQRIRKEVREEWRQKLSNESDKVKKAILKRSEALKSVPILAKQELRELRLEVGSLRAKLADAKSWRNNDYMQMGLDCRLDSLTSKVESGSFPISIANYNFSIDEPLKTETNSGVYLEESRGYFDDINMDSLK